MDTERVLITGARGALGRAVLGALADMAPVAIARSDGTPNEWPLDLVRPDDFDYGALGPGDVVLHLAGQGSPDACVREPELVRAINVDGTVRFIDGALDAGASVVFFSTDVVYGETVAPATEADVPGPAHPYGYMKREVEERYTGEERVKVLRLSYVISPEDRFTRYLLACAEGDRTAELYDPFDRCVVSLEDTVAAIRCLVADWAAARHQVYNLCGPACLSRLDMAGAFRSVIDERLRFQVVSPPPGFFEGRPRRIDCSSARLTDLLGRPPVTLADAYRAIAERRGLRVA